MRVRSGSERIFRLLWAYPNAVLLIAVYSYLLFVLLGYENAWLLPEILDKKQHFLETGSRLNFEDFVRAFNYDFFEAGPRITRPLSTLMLALDTKFRAWLWRYVVPHPSVSLTYLFSLILSPLLLYRLLRNLEVDANTALGGTALYLASPGLLSLVVMLFWPAKPMANFSLILCLYLASELEQDLRRDRGEPAGRFFLLTAVMFVSYFACSGFMIATSRPAGSACTCNCRCRR